jgi:putative hydrolase of HD superfamily
MPSTFTPKSLLSFYREASLLKTILRHSWVSRERQESVAEHTWMMLLLAVVLMPHMEQDLDREKVLQMIVIHDLGEIHTGDYPVWDGQKIPEEKFEVERQTVEKLFAPLDTATREHLLELWHEYEARESAEALFVKAIDTLDVIAQHNTAPLETWSKEDRDWQLGDMQDKYFNMDPLLMKIKDQLRKWARDKITESVVD